MNPLAAPLTSRRMALKTLAASALGLTFARLGWTATESAPLDGDLLKWIRQLNRNAVKLRQRERSPLEWQVAMDTIYGDTPLAALKDHLQFETLSKAILEKMPTDRPEYFLTIRLDAPQERDETKGPEPRRVLITKVAHIRKGHAVPPHGHSNMVSAFLCLSGEFDVRMFDRLDQREESLVVRATRRQQAAGPGTWSSVSDYRDNVHWLTAKTDDCYLFTCKILSLEPGLPLNGRINIDLKQARAVGDDTFVAPKITAAQAQELY